VSFPFFATAPIHPVTHPVQTKSLTDENIRENLRLYGNPDGVQSREEIVAIPKWVVQGKNGIWVLAVYGLGLGGGIPFLVVSVFSYRLVGESNEDVDEAVSPLLSGPVVVLTKANHQRRRAQLDR
jgi:hypothetical protein